MIDAITGYLDAQESEILEFLKRLVLIQSGTSNKPGVDRVGQAIVHELLPIRMAVDEIPHENLGNTLIFLTPAAKSSKALLLIGHMDTVFPSDTDFNWFREDSDSAYGPGVADMKGGLVVGIFALKALAAIGQLDNIPIKFICNSDEEIGSPVSQYIIASEAKKSLAALVLECGSLTNGVVTGRKGRTGFTITAKGVAGHAAYANKNKMSAILELSHKVIELEALNGISPGVTVNVGKISGGIGPNTVPMVATAEVDVRFVDSDEFQLFNLEFCRILGQIHIPGVETTFLMRSYREPMRQSEANRRLFDFISLQARRLGFEIIDELRQGCSDANIVANLKIPVIDGLGPLGDFDHSDREFIIKSSLISRCKLLALSLYEHIKSSGDILKSAPLM
jgi:glutamate carboxypeptidase